MKQNDEAPDFTAEELKLIADRFVDYRGRDPVAESVVQKCWAALERAGITVE